MHVRCTSVVATAVAFSVAITPKKVMGGSIGATNQKLDVAQTLWALAAILKMLT
jgi:hypothetical protein